MMQRMTSLKFLGLSALMATAFVAGCPGDPASDGDTIFNYLRGTNSADTLDNNWGTDANAQSMFVGSNGEIVLRFEQDHLDSNSDPDDDEEFNYYRTLGAGAGAILENEWFAQDWETNSDWDENAVSHNKRYTVLSHEDDNNSWSWLQAYDSADGTFGNPIAILSENSDQLGYINGYEGVVVDNSGIATVFVTAEGSFLTVNGQDDIDSLWALRVDMNTNTIVQDWVRINTQFNTDNVGVEEGHSVDIMDGAIAINGDLCLVVDFQDDYDGTGSDDIRSTIETIYYDASADTWTQTRVDQVDTTGGPYESWSFYDLDTDGKSFQIAYGDYTDDTSFIFQLYSSRFIAGSATSFPIANVIDTGDDTNSHLENWGDITFGRDGSSMLTYRMHHFNFGDLYVFEASWSDELTDPDVSNSWELLSLDDSSAADDLYDTNDYPEVSFRNDGSGSIVFTAQNNDTNVTDEELYIVTFDNTGAGTPAAPGTDNVADADTPTGTDQGREVDFGVSGYSNPQNGGVSTNVVGFQSYYWDNTGGAQEEAYRMGVILISDDTYGAAEYLQDNTVYPIEDAWMSSTNDIKTGGSYYAQWDDNIDPDTLPAVGNGVVWVVFTQVTLVDGDSGQVRAHAWNWNPNTQLGAINDLTRDILTWDGDVEYIESVNPSTTGAASIFLNYMGETVRVNVNPSTSGTVAGTSDGGVDVTPADMSGGYYYDHVDGMSFKRTISATDVVTSTFQGGAYIWSIWEGHDILSERVWGKRTR